MAKNDTDPKLQPFLDEYKKRIDKMPHGLERSIESALWRLLSYSIGRFRLCDIDDGYFHKSFRQVDVTDSGNLDMAFHGLLDASEVFWSVRDKMFSSDTEDDVEDTTDGH